MQTNTQTPENGHGIRFCKSTFLHLTAFVAYLTNFVPQQMAVIGWKPKDGKITKIFGSFLEIIGDPASIVTKLQAYVPFKMKDGYRYLGYFAVGKQGTQLAGYRLFDVTGGFDSSNPDDLTALEITGALEDTVANTKTHDLFLTVPRGVKTDSVLQGIEAATINLTRTLGLHNVRMTEDGMSLIGWNRDGALVMLTNIDNAHKIEAWHLLQTEDQGEISFDGYIYAGRPRVEDNTVTQRVFNNGNTIRYAIDRGNFEARIISQTDTGDTRVIDDEAPDNGVSFGLKDMGDGRYGVTVASKRTYAQASV